MKNKNQEEQIETQGGKNNWVRHVTLIASVNESCNISTSSVWFIEHLLCARSHFFFVHMANPYYRPAGQVVFFHWIVDETA